MSDVALEVWGSRGSRSTAGSRIGDRTSCYAVRAGAELFVFDAGRGLVHLAEALARRPAWDGVARVHVFVTHAHLDHWEGLKDAAWLWAPRNGLEVEVHGPAEALAAIARGHEPPAFVPLEVLAQGTLARLTFTELTPGERALGAATLRAVPLHHYSGIAPARRHLDTLGYALTLPGGASVAYLCDHEPTAATRAIEDDVLARAHVAIVDASYGAIADHAFGHGSVEYAADLARRHPRTLVLAAHHGPMRSDEVIEAALARHGAGLPNLALAVEGTRRTWEAGAFAPPAPI